MQTQRIFMDAEQAEELYKKYLTHRHYETPEDAEIRKAYRLLSKGELIIRAIDSVKQAGVDEKGYPRLAIARATASHCHLSINADGSASMRDKQWVQRRTNYKTGRNHPSRQLIGFTEGSFDTSMWSGIKTKRFPYGRRTLDGEAIMPTIPADIRPKRGLENYHVLWEAEWEPVPPVDPYLLRRIGKSDMWLVVGMWDLTEVEQAVLAGRMATQ